jgi:hypothetical protein
MREALEVIPRFEELGVDLTLLDGNLSGGSSGNDGERLAKLIKDKFPQMPIIGFSSDPEGVRGADVSWEKGKLLANGGLAAAINALQP